MDISWPQAADLERLAAATPGNAVLLDALRASAVQAAEAHAARGLRWRPAVDHNRLKSVCGVIAECGAAGVSVGRVGEAVRASAAGFKSVLLTVPPVMPGQAARLASVCRSCAVTVVCDHFAQAEPIAAACRAEGVEAGVLLRVDVGRYRLGVRPGPDLADLACGIARLSGVRLAGLFAGEPSVPIGGIGALVRDGALPRFLDRCASSLKKAGCVATTVSVSALSDLGGEVSVATESRTPLPLCGAAAVLAGVAGRPTRDLVVIDAGSEFLSPAATVHGVPAGAVEVSFVGRDFSVLRLHQLERGWEIGEVIALAPGAEIRLPASGIVVVGEGGIWRAEEVCGVGPASKGEKGF